MPPRTLEPPGGYASWVQRPESVAAANLSFVMNTPGPPKNTPQTHAHIAHMSAWASVLGFRRLLADLGAAQQLAVAAEETYHSNDNVTAVYVRLSSP